jgi:hypothetical protein
MNSSREKEQRLILMEIQTHKNIKHQIKIYNQEINVQPQFNVSLKL